MNLLRKAKQKIGQRKPQRFLLLCHQRSGSNMLSSIVNQHADISLFGQLFKEDTDFRNRVTNLGITDFEGPFFDDQIQSRDVFDRLDRVPEERTARNTASFLNAFFPALHKQTTASRLGIKVHGGTLYREELSQLLFNDHYKIIVLHRKNLLAAAVSWYQARELDQWMRRSKQQVEKRPIEMDIDQLAWFIEHVQADIALWKRLLHEQQQAFLELTYEEITDADFDFSTIWNFLDVKNIGNPPSKTKKLIKDYSHITNLSTIRAELASEAVGLI